MALSFLLHDIPLLWTMTKKVFICHRHFEGLVRVVTHAPFYYVFTTNDCLNMPRFAPICPFCNIQTKICSFFKTRIMRHTTAYCGISGRRNPMTKILFVCHGSRSGSFAYQGISGQNAANGGHLRNGLLPFCYDWNRNKKASWRDLVLARGYVHVCYVTIVLRISSTRTQGV